MCIRISGSAGIADVFVDRSDFQYCSMDTDSAYMALSTDTLEEVVKPH
jgi:hypothetical protein